MKDILLTESNDLAVDEHGDISLTDSVRQAARIRLQWFLAENRLMPEFGMPYFEEIFIKGPNLDRVRSLIRDKVMSVAEVIDVRNIVITVDKTTRTARVALEIATDEDSFRLEELIYG